MPVRQPMPYNATAARVHETLERTVNAAVRTWDRFARPLGLGVRISNYDDLSYAFEGGVGDKLRKKHYDKSLRLLWKAEQHAPFTSFRDCTRDERAMMQLAEQGMTKLEKRELKRIRSEEYRQQLKELYTPEQRQAIVNILSLIGHGEAYAWIISNQLLGQVKSTGGRAALTMQVLEEAKHFVVLREVLEAFDCENPRMQAWEYILLENIVRAKGVEKFFGMNVVVEGVALSLFGLMGHSFPGLEFLKMFHLDESRHTGLPHSYFEEFPMTTWQKINPVAMNIRMATVAPLIPLIFNVEKDFAVLGLDVFEFAGSVLRKIAHLTNRVGFYLPVPTPVLLWEINLILNAYCYLTRPGHSFRNFITAETTSGDEMLKVEAEAFALDKQPAAAS